MAAFSSGGLDGWAGSYARGKAHLACLVLEDVAIVEVLVSRKVVDAVGRANDPDEAYAVLDLRRHMPEPCIGAGVSVKCHGPWIRM